MNTHPDPAADDRPIAAPAGALVSLDDEPTPPPARRWHRHDGWTPARQVAFLRELAASHDVSRAARSVGMGRQSAYKPRARLRGEPFDLAWAEAFQCSFDALAQAAMERALHGVEVPHYHKGELVGTSRRYDERLTLGLLAMRHDLRPPPQASFHPASAYEWGEFAALLTRVEEGPPTWEEQQEAELEARIALYAMEEAAAQDEAEDEADDEDEDGEGDEAEAASEDGSETAAHGEAMTAAGETVSQECRPSPPFEKPRRPAILAL